MTHVRTSPYYPQSNGKIERWHKTLKGAYIRVKTPLDLEEARRVTADYVQHYNEVRLQSAVGYITPAHRLAKCHQGVLQERKHKLIDSRERRRQVEKMEATLEVGIVGEDRAV